MPASKIVIDDLDFWYGTEQVLFGVSLGIPARHATAECPICGMRQRRMNLRLPLLLIRVHRRPSAATPTPGLIGGGSPLSGFRREDTPGATHRPTHSPSATDVNPKRE